MNSQVSDEPAQPGVLPATAPSSDDRSQDATQQVLAPDTLPETKGFIGREAELASYLRQMNESHVAAIVGMPGVGKSSLAAVLAQRVAAPAQIFWYTFEQHEQFQPIIRKMAEFLLRHGQRDLWDILQSMSRPDAAHLAPRELLDSVMHNVADHGFVLCLDDFQHVAEVAELNDLGKRLVAAAKAGRLSLILTAHQLPIFLSKPSEEPQPLRGLTEHDARALLVLRGVSVNQAQFALLYARTEGYPYSLSLVADQLHGGVEIEELLAEIEVSDNIEAYLLERMGQYLSEDERRVMRAVALLGQGATAPLIEAVLPDVQVRNALSSLSHLLTVMGTGKNRAYGQHALVRNYFVHQKGAPAAIERKGMHLRAAQFLGRQNDAKVKMDAARHFAAAGEHGQAASVATGALREIINQGRIEELRQLIETLGAMPLETLQQAEVQIALGETYQFLSDSEAAKRAYGAAVWSLGQLGPAAGTGQTRVLKARAALGLGDLLQYEQSKDALRTLDHGLAQLAGRNEALEAALWIKSGTVLIALGDFDEAERAVQQGLALLPAGPSHLAISAEINLGTIYSSRGNVSQGRRHTARALAMSQELHDEVRTLSILNNAGLEKEIAGEWLEAIKDYQKALALAQRLGIRREEAKLRNNLGILVTNRGDWPEAEEHLQRAEALARELGLKLYLAAILSSRADLDVRSGRWHEALQRLAEAEQVAVAADVGYPTSEIHCLRSQALRAQGNLAAAREEASRAVELADGPGLELEKGKAQRALAQALLAEGQIQPAIAALEESLDLLADQDPYEAARTKTVLGLVLIENGQSERGKGLLIEAQEKFKKLGATHDLATVDSILTAG